MFILNSFFGSNRSLITHWKTISCSKFNCSRLRFFTLISHLSSSLYILTHSYLRNPIFILISLCFYKLFFQFLSIFKQLIVKFFPQLMCFFVIVVHQKWLQFVSIKILEPGYTLALYLFRLLSCYRSNGHRNGV